MLGDATNELRHCVTEPAFAEALLFVVCNSLQRLAVSIVCG